MKIRSGVSSVICAVISAGALLSAQANASGMTMRTKVIHVKPFLPSGQLAPGYMMVAHARGYCWTNSIASGRHDAFRCLTGNAIHDPCFRNPKGSRVACVDTDPAKLFVIHLTRKLPAPASGGGPSFWLVRLENGAMCQLDTGATFTVDGKRANFSCTDKLWLFGRINTSRQPWRIRKGRGLHAHLTWAVINTLWF
jgi:hypothetical protein